MATDIAEALQSAGVASAKPVTLEAIPEATIDVGGGSQSLDIEGLGVKRRRDDLSVATASTSGLAIEDLFGDLLDEVNFADPVSVDSFRANAATRINEFDSDTLSRVTTGASTVASDLANLAGPLKVTPAAQPVQTAQQQFQQVFGPSRVTTGDDADPQTQDISFDPTASTELQDISALSNPGLAANLFGGIFGAVGGGTSVTDLGISLGQQSLGEFNFVGAQNAAESLLNADIKDPLSAAAALNTAVGVGQKAAQVKDLINQGVTINSLFDRAAKNVGEYIEGIYTAITNPDQAMEAFGRQMEFGTLNPQVFSYELPGGGFAAIFDKNTGQLAAPPKMFSYMLGPLRGVFEATQTVLGAIGYNEEVSDRALGMANAFSTAGVKFSDATTSAAGLMGFADITDQSNVNAVNLDFTGLIGFESVGNLAFDMNALSEQLADTGITADNISITDINQAAVGQLNLDAYSDAGLVPDEEIADNAIREAFNNYATSRGLDNNNISGPGGIAESMARESVAASQAFVDTYNDLAQASGVKGLDTFFTYEEEGKSRTISTTALQDALATELQGRMSTAIAAPGITYGGIASLSRSFNPETLEFFDPPTPDTSKIYTEEQKNLITQLRSQKQLERIEAQTYSNISAAVDAALSFEDGGYNSPNPSNFAIEVAQEVLDRTNSVTLNNSPEQQLVAESIKNRINEEVKDQRAATKEDIVGDLSFGYVDAPSIGTAGVSAAGLEAAGQIGAKSEDDPDPDPEPEIFDPELDPEESGEGADSGGDDKVICTALKDMGLLDEELWQHDGAYGRTLPLETRQGYWAWGVPTAKFIRKNRWAAKAIRPVVTEVAKEMAHRVGYGRGSKLGAALLYVGLPMCRVINRIKNNGNNTRSVYS